MIVLVIWLKKQKTVSIKIKLKKIKLYKIYIIYILIHFFFLFFFFLFNLILGQKGSPTALLFAVVSNAISGFIFLIAVSFMVKSYDDQIIGENAIQPQMVQVFLDGVGPAWSMVFLIFVMLSIFFSGSALTLGSSRMVYAFARDGAMPFSKQLHSLNPKTKSPVFAVWFNVIVAGIVGILYIINSTAYTAIVSVNTIGSQLSYFVPILLRVTTARNTFQPGPWHLGKFSIIIGWISCAWILFTCCLFILPTQWPVTPDNMVNI